MASGWEELEKWMDNQRLPKGFDLMMNQPDWIESYVRKMMSKALPAAASVIGPRNVDIVETKNFVIVTYALGENADLDRLRLIVKEDRIKLSGLPSGKPELFKLPKLVLPRTCLANYDGAVLKIKLRKRPPGKRGYEARITRSP